MTLRLSGAFCGVLLTIGALARAQTPVEAQYLAARRDSVRAFDTLPASAWNAGMNQRKDRALADLERRLRTIVGPVDVAGFPQPGTINLGGLCTTGIGCGMLDALAYRTPDWSRQLLVSTRGVVAGWLAEHRYNGSVEVALRSIAVLHGMIDENGNTYHFADLAIPGAARRGILYAALVGGGQDFGPFPPGRVLVTVARGERVYIIHNETAVPIDTLQGCGNSFAEVSSDSAFARYRACYGRNVSRIPGLATIVEQVSGLVDALPGTVGSNGQIPDRASLQGSWRVIDARARMSNEPAMIIDGLVDRGTVEFNGDVVTMRQLGNTDFAKYSFVLDTVALPRRIRLVGQVDSVRWTGLYRVRGDTLRLSLPIEHFSDRPVPPASFNAPNTAAYTFKRDRP